VQPASGERIDLTRISHPAEQMKVFIWHKGIAKNTGILGLPYAISDEGTVVGVRTTTDQYGIANRAFVWQRGKRTLIPPTVTARSQAYGVNTSGTVVGERGHRAFSWRRGKLTDLATPGYNMSTAYAVNNSGVIVGHVYNFHGKIKACMWIRGRLRVLPDLGGSINEARFVNGSGDIAGLAEMPNAREGQPNLHVVLWRRGKLLDLTRDLPELSRLPGMVVSGFNDRGDIVVSDPSSAACECCLLVPNR
jgi:uncharacterized membrane protein